MYSIKTELYIGGDRDGSGTAVTVAEFTGGGDERQPAGFVYDVSRSERWL